MENRLMLTVDKLPLIEEAFASIENMEKFCNKILDSKLAPDHFYPKLPGSNDRDYTKGNTAAVMMVLIQGNQLHLPVLTSLQQIVPVNGLLSIKGDGAKGMILGSGKVQPNTWVETESGNIDDGTYSVTVSAERSDTHEKLSRTFSIAQAKRAGLWVTEAMVNGQDGWKYKKSAWYKYPDRMTKYRALGFLARDLFPDVMSGAYITEEARDIPQDTTEIIETESGATITIPDKEHAQKRAGRLTERVADKIPDNKFGEVKKGIQEAQIIEPEKFKWEEPIEDNTGKGKDEVIIVPKNPNESPFIPQKGSVEYMNGKEIKRDEAPAKEGQLTLKQMEEMDTKVLLDMVNADMEMMEAAGIIPGKNTNRKLREIIFAHQNGRLANLIEPFKMLHPTEENAGAGLFPNKDFDNQQTNHSIPEPIKEPAPSPELGNKYNLEVLPFDKGLEREFSTYKLLFNKFMFITPQITTPRYLELAEKLGFDKKYPNKETFLKYATTDEINLLLNSN